jgi:pyridinium-3,5-biscarboxylic acid mononucleotide sulfurtransferase
VLRQFVVVIHPEQKLLKLREMLSSMEGMVIAFSGGMDSTLLLKIAFEERPGKVLAVLAISDTIPECDRNRARLLADKIGAPLELMQMEVMTDPRFTENTPQRCYYCKLRMFESMIKIAMEKNLEHVLDGTNRDDLLEYRPGRMALEELGIRSPLAEIGLTKREIQDLVKRLIPEAGDDPSNTCLATRIPYYEEITKEKLNSVERAEAVLIGLGVKEVRVRYHSELARIEVPFSDFKTILRHRTQIVESFCQIGFIHVTLDIQGLRSESSTEITRSHGGFGKPG